MRVSLKIAFFFAAVIVIALIWIYAPVEKPPVEDVWSQGFKLRLSGFALIGLFCFYIFLDRVVFVKKNKKRSKNTRSHE